MTVPGYYRHVKLHIQAIVSDIATADIAKAFNSMVLEQERDNPNPQGKDWDNMALRIVGALYDGMAYGNWPKGENYGR